MSLILDALNRSRQDAGAVPGLETHAAPGAPASRTPLVLLALALLAALAVIATLLWQRTGSAPAPRPAPSAAATASGEASAPVATPAPRAEPAPQPVAAPVEAVAPVPAATQAPRPAAVTKVKPAEPDPQVAALYEEMPAEVAQEPASEPGATPQAQVAPAVEEEQIDVDAMLRKAENELENNRLEAHPTPFLEQLSQHTKDAVPTLLYSAHAYSGRAGQSTVVLNGQQLKVGGSPAAGVKIEEILPDSVVLSFRGDRFRLRALNSWVNL